MTWDNGRNVCTHEAILYCDYLGGELATAERVRTDSMKAMWRELRSLVRRYAIDRVFDEARVTITHTETEDQEMLVYRREGGWARRLL